MNDKYIFPCIITYEDSVYYVDFPDIEDCFTDGKTLEEALDNAKDVLGLILYDREKRGIAIPKASSPFLKTEDKQFVSLVDVWMPLVRDKIEQKSIKKTLTIPKWLNDAAEAEGINFSHMLQVSIKNYLGLKTKM
ncbi:MAG: type II toxin-antitoxin system HicB family antitoxin [Tissierellia bacterium]|nr:type II toxin-antitoxin system HicB family antitoxin [Tissierellia bacterium]